MFLLLVLTLLFAVAIAVAAAFQAVTLKFKKYRDCWEYMMRGNDTPVKFQGSNSILTATSGPEPKGNTQKVRIVFIRHGESVWNSIYNEVDIGLPLRILHTLFLEMKYVFTRPFDSKLIDTPLSAKGIKQAKELGNFLRATEGKITFDPTTSVILCSNLRRAMQTALIGLSPRLNSTKEKIVVESMLQEGSTFIDTQSFSTEKGKIAPMTFSGYEDPEKVLSMFDAHLNHGNKTIGMDMYARTDIFLHHVFDGTIVPAATCEQGARDLKEIIVVGHSVMFLHFFRRFLPRNSSHLAMKYKMENCAVVAFDLIRNVSTGEVVIDENSISPLYKGFIKALKTRHNVR